MTVASHARVVCDPRIFPEFPDGRSGVVVGRVAPARLARVRWDDSGRTSYVPEGLLRAETPAEALTAGIARELMERGMPTDTAARVAPDVVADLARRAEADAR